MAGNRQHVLPQFLLRGFTSREEKDNCFSWVFRKNSVSFETNIINIAVSNRFYTTESDSQVDDEITKAENDFGLLISDLRRISKSTEVTSEDICHFLAHLEIRTRHLRESLLESSSILINELLDFLKDTKTLKEIVLKKIHEDPSLLSDAIEKEFKNCSLQPGFKELIRKLALQNAPKLLKDIEPYLAVFVEVLSKEIPNRLPKMAKTGHINALKKTIVPDSRVDAYRNLKFHIKVFDNNSLILGDFGVLIEVESKRRFKTIREQSDKLRNVYLPISKNHLLVGSNQTNINISLSELLRAIAESSREFFISSHNVSDNEKLAQNIGMNCKLLSDEELKLICTEIFNDEINGIPTKHST